MLVYKCDVCKDEIKDRARKVAAGYGSIMATYSFCPKCGKPIISFLKKHGFIEKKKTTRSRK